MTDPEGTLIPPEKLILINLSLEDRNVFHMLHQFSIPGIGTNQCQDQSQSNGLFCGISPTLHDQLFKAYFPRLTTFPDLITVVTVSGMYPIQQVHLVRNEKSSHIISLVNRTKISDCKNKLPKGQPRKAKINNGFRKGKIHRSPNITQVIDLDRFKGIKISSATNLCSEDCATSGSNSCDAQISLINFVGADDSILPIDIKSHARVGEYVEICPDQIYDPHKFYFRFRKFQRKFADFMDKMQSFYETNENIPQMTDRVIKPKLICAVFHKISKKPMWLRGEITQITSKSHVHVTFIDYGCKAEVSKRNLKFLHRDFTSLPKQAVLGSLANIRPSKGKSKWSSDAVKRFSALACGRDLIAGVVAIDADACSMSVALSCTKGLEFHINDTLVKEGYAEFDADIFNNCTADNLKLPVSEKTWKSNFGKTDTVISKTDFTKEDVLKSMTNCASPIHGTPIFYYSSNSSGNQRLQKMFSAVE